MRPPQVLLIELEGYVAPKFLLQLTAEPNVSIPPVLTGSAPMDGLSC
jgi:hypothetical protein